MTIERYVHHGREVAVDTALKGRHRAHCLCWTCGKFAPGEPDNCPIAQSLFALCVAHDLVTPVYECPEYAIAG